MYTPYIETFHLSAGEKVVPWWELVPQKTVYGYL